MTQQREGQLSTADMVAGAREKSAADNGELNTTPETGQTNGAQIAASGSSISDGAAETASKTAPLLSSSDSGSLRTRWTDIQAQFVDEPRRCVEQADSLVAELMQRLATMFADERSRLEQQWGRGDEVSTEDLRQALQRYRSFFERLLTV